MKPARKRWKPIDGPGCAKLERADGQRLSCDPKDGCWFESDHTGNRPTAEGIETYDLIEALEWIEERSDG